MKKVLIVEDEILARLGLRQLVDWKKLDLELLPDATDGEEALEMIRNSRPDIILLDLNIPRVSGLEILEFLKKEEMQNQSNRGKLPGRIRCCKEGNEVGGV
mgnify:CR=1 FL=1